MQLRCYMNGHHRLGDPQFPFSSDRGFVRSHRMQRKQYRGLSNPQCIHGIEFVRLPNFAGIVEEDLKKWMELTGRELNFSIPIEASDFGSWRNTPTPDFELDRSPSLKCIPHPHPYPKRMLNGSGFMISMQSSNHNSMDLSPQRKKLRKEFSHFTKDEECCLPTTSYTDWHQEKEVHDPAEPPWIKDFSSLMRHVHGPVTAAKTIYEDDEGHLIIVSLPFCEQRRVKVCWRNGPTHGIVKISCVSTGRMPHFNRHGRTFKLADPSPEHCAPGEFVREIPLRTRIPEDANLEAYYDESGTVLEIMVPKHSAGPQEHEIHVSMHPPHLGTNDLMLNWECSVSSL
ncbi:hypothetical protein HPP92_000799 [Vanilla planifolia]|uniref:HSP20-like chaperones superfamily protein n=1 Tax=Vanilla planifolia TaxID=51239 RepID=A0A835RST3_VANPL|nr:hypothetical protein HPP92_000799 [Vanilla planifolia]